MSGFRPRIRKKKLKSVEAIIMDTVSEYFNRIRTVDPQVFEIQTFDMKQEMANTWPMNVNTDEVLIGMFGGHFGKRLAIPKSNFKNQGRFTVKDLLGQERLTGVQAKDRP
jgi:hypothetical protein